MSIKVGILKKIYVYLSSLVPTFNVGTSIKDFDWDDLAKSTALGAAGGYAGGLGGNLGKAIKDYNRSTPTITNIRYPSIRRDGPIKNYGREA